MFYLGCLYKASKAGVEEAGFTDSFKIRHLHARDEIGLQCHCVGKDGDNSFGVFGQKDNYFLYLRDIERKRRFKLKRI